MNNQLVHIYALSDACIWLLIITMLEHYTMAAKFFWI